MSMPLMAVAAVLVSVGLMLGSYFAQPGDIGWYGDTVEARTIGQPAVNASEASRPAPLDRASVVSAGRMAVQGEPSIDLATVRRVLREYNSPAIGEAEAFMALGRQYGIDPAICLAFFIVESGAGTRGMATETRSVGNIRATPGYVNHKGYRKYSSWREGTEDWYRLISRLYIGEWKLTTVEEIVPVYAPAGDGNDPTRYSDTVRRLVNQWRASR